MKKAVILLLVFLMTASFAIPVSATKNEQTTGLPIQINAKSFILVEVSSGEVLLESNADEQLQPASVTKIMTILLAVEAIEEKKISLDDSVSCSSNASKKGGSQIWLKEGETMTVDELLRATVIGGANDAATLLGEYISGSEEGFVARMNERAKELKMNHTCFENATGLDDTSKNHLTTARDIAIMSCELLRYDWIQKYTTVWMDALRDGATELVNTNKLVRFYKGTTGLKTGTTSKAGCCISASAMRDGLHLVAVVMGCDNSSDRFEGAKALLNWGFANYCVVTPAVDASLFHPVKVLNGTKNEVSVQVPSVKPILVKKGESEKLEQILELSDVVSAPIEKNQTVGTLTFETADGKVAEYQVYAAETAEKLNLLLCISRLFLFFANQLR